MKALAIDIETYCEKDLMKCGVYAYTQDPSFEILLFAYEVDEEGVQVVDFKSGQVLPFRVREALTDPKVIKTAFNAAFERTCLAAWFKEELPPEQWQCTAVKALELGLPGSLQQVGRVLNLEEQKLEEGKDLIKLFSMKVKPTAANRFRTRNLPWVEREKWELFKEYCKRDVRVESLIRKKLDIFRLHKGEQLLWQVDQRINERGIKVDSTLIENALHCAITYEDVFLREAEILTGLKNPKSAQQMKLWLFKEEGIQVQSLNKKEVERLLEEIKNPQVKKALKLRQQVTKTSIKKYSAMKAAMGQGERIRGLFQFYGANRTGRWAGRLVQVQNLPQSSLENLQEARTLLKEGSYKALENNFGSVSEVLSKLIRTAFIPKEGHEFIVSDFNAIEPRIVAWLSGESWRNKVFATHGKLYEASASKMFKVPMEDIAHSSPLRQKGKIAELALGYQGSTGALKTMGALTMGLQEEELPTLVKEWRRSNVRIVNLWHDLEKAAIAALKTGRIEMVNKGICFYVQRGILFINLPSGRSLAYVSPRLEIHEQYGKEVVTYMAVDQKTKKWSRQRTYGGKLLENIVQGIARDILGQAILSLEEEGLPIVIHVHDEVVVEAPKEVEALSRVTEIMEKKMNWARDLILKAESFQCDYYRK